jgi:hypothetical protein
MPSNSYRCRGCDFLFESGKQDFDELLPMLYLVCHWSSWQCRR